MTASSDLLRSFLNESFATVGCFTIEEDNATTAGMSLQMAMSYSAPNMTYGRTGKQQTRSSRKRRIAGKEQSRRQRMDPMPASRWESSPLSPEQKSAVKTTRATIESSPCRHGLSPPRRPLRRNSADLTPPTKPMRQGTIESPLMPQAPASLDDDDDDDDDDEEVSQ